MQTNRRMILAMAMLSPFCLPASAEEINIYQKTLADKQQIVVTRQEIPVPSPTPQQKAAEERYIKDHPGFSFKVHLYQYLFNLTSADGKRQTTLWVHKEGGPAPAPKTGVAIEGNQSIQVLDALVQDGALIVAYEQGLWAEGVVVKLDGTQGPRVLPHEYDNFLPTHRQGADSTVRVAHITGFLKDGTLAVVTETCAGETLTFHFQHDQWQLDPKNTPVSNKSLP